MAKKTAVKKPRGKRSESKSQKAREYKASHATASTQEIADALKMSYNAVYQALKKEKPTTKAAAAPVAPAASNGHASAYEVIMLAKQFVAKAGGITNAAEILHALLTTK